MSQKRLYGLDLLRILSMLGIIGLHLLNGGGLMAAASARADSELTARILMLICSCSVNVFAMLTGRLNAYKRSFSTKRLVDLLACVLFYCILITGLLAIFAPDSLIGERRLAASLLPLFYGHYWYLGSYILVFLLMPYMNPALQKMSLRRLKSLAFMLFLLLSVVGVLSYTDPFRGSGGYGPLWLIFCYIVGAALQRADAEEGVSGSRLLPLIVFVICIAVSAALWQYLPSDSVYISRLLNYNSPLTVLCAVSLLIFFAGIPIKGKLLQRTAVILSGSAFAAFIIHAHPILFSELLGGSLSPVSGSRPHTVTAILGLSCAAVYLVCLFAEQLRIRLMSLLRLSRLTDAASQALDTVLGLKDEEVPTEAH